MLHATCGVGQILHLCILHLLSAASSTSMASLSFVCPEAYAASWGPPYVEGNVRDVILQLVYPNGPPAAWRSTFSTFQRLCADPRGQTTLPTPSSSMWWFSTTVDKTSFLHNYFFYDVSSTTFDMSFFSISFSHYS